MKYSTLKFGKTLILAASALLLSNTASAGYSARYEVYVTSYSASGSMNSARVSNDTTQFIGCSLLVGTNSSGDSVYCTAKNRSGKFFYCYTYGSSVANLKKALKTIDDRSNISMYKNTNGTCSSLNIDSASFYF